MMAKVEVVHFIAFKPKATLLVIKYGVKVRKFSVC